MMSAGLGEMSYSVNMSKLVNRFAVSAALMALALPAYAQSEQAVPTEQAAPTESSANTEQSPKIETAAKAEPSVGSSVEPKTEPSIGPKAEPAAQNAPAVDAFVAKLDSATRAIHENSKNDHALIREGCRQLLNDMLDLDAMARATNDEMWEKMTAPQRETFRAAFEHRMVGSCVRQLGTYTGETLQLAGVRTTDEGYLLATIRVGSQDDAKLVTWRLRNSGSQNWRAVDVIAEGRSAVLDAHNEFAAVLQSVNGDIEALISFMQK